MSISATCSSVGMYLTSTSLFKTLSLMEFQQEESEEDPKEDPEESDE